jgi:NAD(P)-dependent dehydrogenase (short-subunit alcohol dehydrogenase family)
VSRRRDAFDLTGRVVVITGGAGLLGRQHAEAVAARGAVPVLLDLDGRVAAKVAKGLGGKGYACDITDARAVARACAQVLKAYGRVDALINNAANNPKVEDPAAAAAFSRLENFPLDAWERDIAVGLTGAMLCSRTFGAAMATAGKGVIVNVASDLGLIAPDQRLYRRPDLADDRQPVKPVTYSVVKAGLIGLTRYLATYWADKGVRANAIAPGGVYAGQDETFVARLSQLIPLGRMAATDEYQGAIVFLVSDASSYMTGTVLVADGGRSCW